MTGTPLILWFRRDLRLADHPMLTAAVATGRPLIPVFLADPQTLALGAAPKWRLGLGVAHFADRLVGLGSRLVLRRGAALESLRALVAETGAGGVWWTRAYDPASVARDTAVKAALKDQGLDARSFPGHLMHEPWQVETGQGGFYRVFTPYWNATRSRAVPAPDPAPRSLRAPDHWPASDRLQDWHLGAAMQRGAAVVARHVRVGEDRARDRLARFLTDIADSYADTRNLVAIDGTSRLSENLTYGEIGIREVWHAGLRARDQGVRGAEAFLRELAWREFSYHLMHHTPHITATSWKPDWDQFPWRGDTPAAESWRRGMTGIALVDAALREMYVTGTMHNRARMVAASYLTKHLMTHWKLGLDWFADCLTDWDPAANAMGWQWVAGCGPDAAPYFRVFNPDGQADKFDADGTYRRRFVAELSPRPGPDALSYFDAVPRAWGLSPRAPYPAPVAPLAEGRALALAAYGARSA